MKEANGQVLMWLQVNGETSIVDIARGDIVIFV